MKNNSNNYHTEGSGVKQSGRQTTHQSFKLTQHDESISKKFKDFLTENSASYRKTLRTSEQSRMNMSNTMKKTNIYRKLLTSSSNKHTMIEEMAKYKQKFESAARKGTKDISSIVFRQFWEQEQKRKFDQSRQSQKKGAHLKMQSKNKNKNGDVKSFEGFVQNQKRQTHKRLNFQAQHLVSMGTEEQKRLTVAGNHKNLNSKEKSQLLKRLGVRKCKTPVLPGPFLNIQGHKQVQNQQQKAKQQQIYSERSSAKENTQVQNHPVFYPKNNISGTYCLKNLYSPFNGIQIKYLSIDSNNHDQYHSPKKLAVKNSGRPISRPLFKPQKSLINEKSITFKSKKVNMQQDVNHVEGWKVEPDFNEEINDLCIRL